jgi:hypothetical protein
VSPGSASLADDYDVFVSHAHEHDQEVSEYSYVDCAEGDLEKLKQAAANVIR